MIESPFLFLILLAELILGFCPKEKLDDEEIRLDLAER
jgi:hypothetical protein